MPGRPQYVAAAGKKGVENTSTDIIQPAEKLQDPVEEAEPKLQGGDESAALVDQGETTARRWTRKAGVIIQHQPKRRWAALTATVAATAGLVAGWVIRRGRSRKQSWPRRGR